MSVAPRPDWVPEHAPRAHSAAGTPKPSDPSSTPSVNGWLPRRGPRAERDDDVVLRLSGVSRQHDLYDSRPKTFGEVPAEVTDPSRLTLTHDWGSGPRTTGCGVNRPCRGPSWWGDVFLLGERSFADAYYIELWVRGYPVSVTSSTR
jgi:hypothetical protein